ncbi:MAG: DMT family transporter [Rhodobacter sp.]|nr:DMT family transporter [Rhodobacter sp.]
MTIAYFFLALAMGAAVSIYIPMASQSSAMMGSPVLGNVPFFAVAFLSSVVIALGSGFRPGDISRVAHVPAWLFLSGAVSAVMIIGASFLVPRIGTGVFFVLLVTGQILLGAVISQFGLFNVPEQPINLMKAFGILMVLAGAILVSFNGTME